MDGDGIPEDRSEAVLGCRVERVLEQPAEDTEAPIGGVDDRGARLGGGDTGSGISAWCPTTRPSWTATADSSSPDASPAIKYRGR